MTDVVHVITDLGPTDGPGLVVRAQLGRITRPEQEFIGGMPVFRYDPWKDTP